MDLAGKKIVVVGLARTGLETARFLVAKGAMVTVTDRLSENRLGPAVKEAREMGCALELGEHKEQTFTSADFVVVSPGVPHDIPPLKAAAGAGVKVMGEMELAFGFLTAPVLAITGTNGKTTTTAFLGHVLKAAGMKVFVGGNIGTPLIKSLMANRAFEAVVAEVSSFQLDTIHEFRPKVALLLNITEDHLDRYENFAAYAGSKAAIFKNQTADDAAVINHDDETAMEMGKRTLARPLYFGSDFAHTPPVNGAVLAVDPHDPEKRQITLYQNREKTVLDLSNTPLKGRHNLENMAAAFLAAKEMGVDPAAMRQAALTFRGPAHRLELVGRVNKAAFYNDSKATNPVSVIRALESFSEKVVLILGGRNKEADFSLLLQPVKKACRFAVFYGEAAPELELALGKTIPHTTAGTLKEAVKAAAKAALPQDVVLLSPGCASFDLYDNYEARGDDFRRLVGALS